MNVVQCIARYCVSVKPVSSSPGFVHDDRRLLELGIDLRKFLSHFIKLSWSTGATDSLKRRQKSSADSDIATRK